MSVTIIGAFRGGEAVIWLDKAKSYLGLAEVPGKRHNAKILGWWKAIKATFTDDETPWCAAFVGGVLEECGILSTRKANARSYIDWGEKLPSPVVGCVVVFWRGSIGAASGHVGFVVGRDLRGNLLVLGGNQGDKVSIMPFSRDRVLAYRWPKCNEAPEQIAHFYALPVIENTEKLSTNEA